MKWTPQGGEMLLARETFNLTIDCQETMQNNLRIPAPL